MSGYVAESDTRARPQSVPAPDAAISSVVEEPTVPVHEGAADLLDVGRPPEISPDLVAQYERLAARVLFSEAQDRFTLVVTSALSGEGVTTTCVGVGLALAKSTSQSVLIVDANLRRPALHWLFQIRQQPGLREMITYAHNLDEWLEPGRASLTALGVTRTTVPNLFVLPSGATADNPTQLMTSGASRTCFELLSSRFAYVIVDCPPLLTAMDAGSLCRMGTGIAIVIRAGLTLREDVRRARERLNGAPVMGVVLNGA